MPENTGCENPPLDVPNAKMRVESVKDGMDSSDMLGAVVEDEGDVGDVLDTGDMLEKDAMKVEKLVACMMPMIRWMRDEDADEVVDVSEYKEDAMEEVNAEGDAGDVLDAGDILDAR